MTPSPLCDISVMQKKSNCVIIIEERVLKVSRWFERLFKFEDKHTILKTQTQQNQSFRLSAFIYSFFFFLLPHLNLSERPCFWLTDLQPHLVTRSCCQHSFSEKSSCQTTLPWSTAKTRRRVRRERVEKDREPRCLAGQLLSRSDRTQPIRSRVTRLTSLWWKKETEPEPERDGREKHRNTKHVFSKKWAPYCLKCSPVDRAKSWGSFWNCDTEIVDSLLPSWLTCTCPLSESSHARDGGASFRLSVKSLGPCLSLREN